MRIEKGNYIYLSLPESYLYLNTNNTILCNKTLLHMEFCLPLLTGHSLAFKKKEIIQFIWLILNVSLCLTAVCFAVSSLISKNLTF